MSLLLVGCGKADTGPQRYPITGTVTYDGQPLPTGTILLQDPNRAEKTYVATISEGIISGEATPGTKQLVVTAVRQATGKLEPSADGSGMEAATEQYLPERYNVKTELTTEIQPSRENVLTLELSSK